MWRSLERERASDGGRKMRRGVGVDEPGVE